MRFGRFELQPDEHRLLVDGTPAALGGRALDLLTVLAERPGQLVGKHALMDRVWPGLVVQENNLAAQISALRKVLGGDVIATIPGRGYRFIAPIESSGHAGAPAQAAPSLPKSDSAAAAAAAAPTLRTNLPAELPALLGRADELDALAALVERHRLVSIVGAGGMGKSLLAQHLLVARRQTYPQGVCWVELTQVADGSALPGAIAAALAVDTGHGEPLAALIGAVAPLTMLLALDNAEHLLADVAQLCKALHEAAPGLRLLITSQAPLKLAAERVFRIAPLAVPGIAMPAERALQFGAVALFAERAQAVDQRFSVSDASAPAVIEACRALDGLPLAIELAAARAPMLGMVRLLASMHERFDLLSASRNRAAPARQQTLRSAVDWSHGLLQAREQQVFRRLGVMAGSASLALIQQVLVDGDDGFDLWAVFDALDTLVDRSLVSVLPSGDAGEPRYRLLETPRAYALEELQKAGEVPRLQRRHALAVAAMFDAAYDEYFTGRVRVDDWLRRLEPELDHARDAVRWGRDADEPEVVLRVGATMLRALPPSLHMERMALADICEARTGAVVAEDLQLQAHLELSCVLADSQKARGRHAAEQALALARRLDARQADRFVLYHALCRAASAAAQAGDLAAARALLDESRGLEDPSWPAQRLLWGTEAAQWFARMSGDASEALQRGRRLVALDRERGSDAAIAIGNLIDAELAAGDAAAAARLATELIESLLGTRHEFSLAFARINLLAALLAEGDADRARPVAQAAWSRAAAFDLQHAAAAYLALLCALEGRHRAAVKLAAYSEAIYAARGEVREGNETAATTRAQALAREALGETAFARLHAEGAALRDAAAGELAFAAGDAA